MRTMPSCIISSFYIKPQPEVLTSIQANSCIISSFYIKPQPDPSVTTPDLVVLYLHSTSNHNGWAFRRVHEQLYYIFILHQTTTPAWPARRTNALYYIFILHQTTTWQLAILVRIQLYYIFILHQTTTWQLAILVRIQLYYIFILHQTTTVCEVRATRASCIISSFYIKPQPWLVANIFEYGCIISSFYIKPQLDNSSFIILDVVLYLHSTSNHNAIWVMWMFGAVVLYLHSTSNHNLQILNRKR